MKKYLIVLFAILMPSCISEVPQVAKITVAQEVHLSYCLRAKVQRPNKLESVELCTETKKSCERALKLAKDYGSIADIKQVDVCVKKGNI